MLSVAYMRERDVQCCLYEREREMLNVAYMRERC